MNTPHSDQTNTPAAEHPNDRALDELLHRYVRGYYLCSPEEVWSTLHPQVNKVGLGTTFLGRPIEHLAHLTHDQIAPLAKFHNADGRFAADARNEVAVLHRTAATALAVVYGADFMDYFHLARLNGRWLIVNAVYGGLPAQPGKWSDADAREVEAEVARYGAATGEKAVADAIHAEFVRRRVERVLEREVLAEETAETFPLLRQTEGASPSDRWVRVFGVAGPIATAAIEDSGRVEYVDLVRIDGRWRIVHALLGKTSDS